MYRWLRNVHLAVGLFSTLFLFGFGLSGLQLSARIFEPSATETSETIEIPAGFQSNPRALAWWLMEKRGIRGNLANVRMDGAIVSLTIVRAGAVHQVDYDPRTASARIGSRFFGPIQVLNRIHETHGVHHDYWATNGWGWMLFVVSVALLVLALTGIVMWFKRHDDRVIGTIITAAGLGWGLALLVAMRLSRL